MKLGTKTEFGFAHKSYHRELDTQIQNHQERSRGMELVFDNYSFIKDDTFKYSNDVSA